MSFVGRDPYATSAARASNQRTPVCKRIAFADRAALLRERRLVERSVVNAIQAFDRQGLAAFSAAEDIQTARSKISVKSDD